MAVTRRAFVRVVLLPDEVRAALLAAGFEKVGPTPLPPADEVKLCLDSSGRATLSWRETP